MSQAKTFGYGCLWDKPTLTTNLVMTFFDTTALLFLISNFAMNTDLKIEGVCWPGMCASKMYTNTIARYPPSMGHNFIKKTAF